MDCQERQVCQDQPDQLVRLELKELQVQWEVQAVSVCPVPLELQVRRDL